MDLGVVLPITHFAWKYYNSTVPSEKRKSIERFRVNKESGQIFSTGRKSSSAVWTKTVSKFRKRTKSLSCVHVSHKTWNQAFSRRSRAVTGNKCTKKHDARAKLLSCQSKPTAFIPVSLTSPSCIIGTLRSNGATATRTSLEKWIWVFSVFIAIIPTNLLCHL